MTLSNADLHRYLVPADLARGAHTYYYPATESDKSENADAFYDMVYEDDGAEEAQEEAFDPTP